MALFLVAQPCLLFMQEIPVGHHTCRAACDQLTSMLKDAFKSGTAASAKRFCPKVTAAAKTGTSDDCRDGWLAGYTGSLATVVWVGRDDNGSLSGAASRVAAPIWGKFMAAT